MKTKTIPVRGQEISVDLLRFRQYGAAYARVTTADVLALNPGLAALGPILPIGTEVVMPILDEARAPTRAPVTLWSSPE